MSPHTYEIFTPLRPLRERISLRRYVSTNNSFFLILVRDQYFLNILCFCLSVFLHKKNIGNYLALLKTKKAFIYSSVILFFFFNMTVYFSFPQQYKKELAFTICKENRLQVFDTYFLP